MESSEAAGNESDQEHSHIDDGALGSSRVRRVAINRRCDKK